MYLYMCVCFVGAWSVVSARASTRIHTDRLTDPDTPDTVCRATATAGIKQFYIAVEREDWKLDTLCDLYETLTITQVGHFHIYMYICVCGCVML